MAESSSSNSRGVLVTGAAIGINLILGSLYAWGVIAKALKEQWGWDPAQAALPFTVSTISFALMMVFAGRWQDKMGPRLVALLGGVMFGLGMITSSFTNSPTLMWVCYGLLGGIGLGLCYSATTPPAIKWFHPSRKGLIAGLVVAGVGLASVYVAPLTQELLKGGISQTFLILGIGATVLICLLSLVLTNPPAGFVPAAPATKAGTVKKALAARCDLDWHQMLGTGQFWMLWLTFILTASAGLMMIAHVANIAQEQAQWKAGYVAVALLAVFNTLGRVVSGYVSDRIGRRQTMMLAFLLQAANMFAFAYYTSWQTLAFGTCMAGLCYGTIYTLMPAATADYYGVRNLGVNYGLVFTAFGVAGVAGPYVAGLIRKQSGSYATAYIVSAVMLLAGAALAFLTRAPKTAVESPEVQIVSPAKEPASK